MGECVGIAAAMAAKNQCDFLEINYPEYLNKVNQRGCFKSNKQRTFGFANGHPSASFYIPIEFGVDKNLHLLESSTPGVAIWSCFATKDKVSASQKVYDKLLSASTILEKYNCAIALGIMNDTRALPVLREIINNRDAFRFTDCRRSNQLRTSIALCLLGRLGDETDIELIQNIVFGENEFSNKIYQAEVTEYYNPVYFDIFTHATMALIKIYKAHNLDTTELHLKLENLFNDGKIIKRVTAYPYGHPYHMEILDFQNYALKTTK